METVLEQYFGYAAFREGQRPLIEHILQGQDVLGIMPTGGGKSLCYQIPALLLPGLTVVISPLISLMKDQVNALQGLGIGAAFLNSSLDEFEMQQVFDGLRQGAYQILYVAPERLESRGFVALMQRQQIALLAVDEAHCISQWGQDFRPSYQKITALLSGLPRRPVVAAFTATATQQVRQDIIRMLELQNPFTLITGFDRPNLFFGVRRPGNKTREVEGLVLERRGKSGIVYCATRANVEKVCEGLNRLGIAATRYHAGLSDRERRKNQEDFQNDRKTVMVATNAFGMGIDKSNVGFVIHYNMPKSLEAYYQEAGRAGRDGEAADCILLYSAGDIQTAKYLIENSHENSELEPEQKGLVLQRDYERLGQMIGYCKTTGCLRGYILDYFEQEHQAECGNCGNCNSATTIRDITVPAQMILSCVKRAKDFLGYSVGGTLIAQVLHGSKNKRVVSLRLDKLSTYRLMATLPGREIRDYIEFLETQGYLKTNPEYSTLELTERASAVLFGGEKVEMPVKERISSARAADFQKRDSGEEEKGLLGALKQLRTRLAKEEDVPAYIVFSNATLSDMARKRPGDLSAFLDVNGVGSRKAERYGEAFLQAIRAYEREETDGTAKN